MRLYNHPGGRLDLQELMSYPLTPIPYSMATADAFFAKTNKAKGMELITDVDDESSPPDNETLVIEDGNAIFYYLPQVPGISGELLIRFSTSWQKNIRDLQH